MFAVCLFDKVCDTVKDIIESDRSLSFSLSLGLRSEQDNNVQLVDQRRGEGEKICLALFSNCYF